MLLPLMNFKAFFSSLLFYFYLNYCNLVCSHVKHLFSLEGIFFSNSFLQTAYRKDQKKFKNMANPVGK